MIKKNKRNILALLLALSLVLWCAEGSFCGESTSKAETPSTTAQANIEMDSDVKFLSLSVKDSIIYALRNNFDVEMSKLTTKATEYDITTEKARFDPALNLSGNINNTVTPINNKLIGGFGATAISPYVEEGRTADAVLQSLIPTGATVSLEYNIFRDYTDPNPFRLLNPSYMNFIQAQITQPLLKGAGWFYNRSLIYIARNNKKISLAQFRSRAIEVSNSVQETYWNYIRAMENLKVATKSLERAEDLLKKNEKQVEVGTMAPVDVIDAESGVASRVELVISAKNAIKDQEDELKRIMNLADNSIISDATIIPTDKPVFKPEKVELKDAIKIAMEKRPELTELQLVTENAGMQTRRRKNELYPQLDFTGGVTYTGLGKEVSDANDSTFSEKFQGEFMGLMLSIPIGNRSARSAYNKSKINEQQTRINVKKKELDIVVEVREAVRQVSTNVERVKATRKARELAAKRLENEEKKYNVGRSSSLEILRQQEVLTIAEFEEARASIDYEISLGSLERAKGTILEVYDIMLDEEPKT